ncbi:MAG TPA: phospholipase D-like domain-containing protein [Polyangia bacterium]|jgi:Phosphatidylserine/phosphatidylglycerophosphate/cardiolipin synthases and related enzymes|nr:phospholipase D-like domain-containing protein [Polyangia bacterium]
MADVDNSHSPARDATTTDRAPSRHGWRSKSSQLAPDDRAALPQLREFATRAFSRAAGAPLIGGNQVRLLEDARENYPRWLDAIRAAKDHVNFENYFIQDDDTGREFAEALSAKAREGVRVRLIYDWMGSFRKASRRFWRSLRSAGVEVRCYNPPRISRPFGWISRDHRKMLVADNQVGFIAGLCVAHMWEGDPARKLDPWRDTGVEIRGPAVADIERAFARTWALTGAPLTDPVVSPAPVGDVNVRVVSSEPATAGMIRLDELVAALARDKLWLTDAYFNGTTSYVQALRAAAKDGVDVRLLIPNATDIPILKPFSQAGYRTLLEAGVRIFEWNGTMMHAKTAVTDGRWARVGSTNLNIASWLGNCELDAVIEDASFAAQMEAMYLRDLANTTEVVLDLRGKMRAPGQPRRERAQAGRTGGSASRFSAGAVRIGHAISAALTDRRILGPVEARLMIVSGLLFCALSALVAVFPRALGYPAAALGAWVGLSFLWRGVKLRRLRKEQPKRRDPEK